MSSESLSFSAQKELGKDQSVHSSVLRQKEQLSAVTIVVPIFLCPFRINLFGAGAGELLYSYEITSPHLYKGVTFTHKTTKVLYACTQIKYDG